MSVDPITASLQSLASTQKSGATVGDQKVRLEKLRSVSVDFEAMLLQEMFKSMEDTLQEGGLMGSGVSGSVYSGILLETISKSMAETQSLGLSDQLFQDILGREPELAQVAKEQKVAHVKDLQHRSLSDPRLQKLTMPAKETAFPKALPDSL
jgi:Rod binding domain-containing protein